MNGIEFQYRFYIGKYILRKVQCCTLTNNFIFMHRELMFVVRKHKFMGCELMFIGRKHNYLRCKNICTSLVE